MCHSSPHSSNVIIHCYNSHYWTFVPAFSFFPSSPHIFLLLNSKADLPPVSPDENFSVMKILQTSSDRCLWLVLEPSDIWSLFLDFFWERIWLHQLSWSWCKCLPNYLALILHCIAPNSAFLFQNHSMIMDLISGPIFQWLLPIEWP